MQFTSNLFCSLVYLFYFYRVIKKQIKMLFFKLSSNKRKSIKKLLLIKIETEQAVKDHISSEEVFCEKQRGFARLMGDRGNTALAECTLAYIRSKEDFIEDKKKQLASLRSEISNLINLL